MFFLLITENLALTVASNENNDKNLNLDDTNLLTEALNNDIILFDCDLTSCTLPDRNNSIEDFMEMPVVHSHVIGNDITNDVEKDNSGVNQDEVFLDQEIFINNTIFEESQFVSDESNDKDLNLDGNSPISRALNNDVLFDCDLTAPTVPENIMNNTQINVQNVIENHSSHYSLMETHVVHSDISNDDHNLENDKSSEQNKIVSENEMFTTNTKSDESFDTSNLDETLPAKDVTSKRKSKNYAQGIKRQQNIDLRKAEKEYDGLVQSDSGKSHEKIRPPRKMGPRCNHNATTVRSSRAKSKLKNDTSRTFLCAQVDEATRNKKFQKFWAVNSWEAKKAYIFGLVDKRLPYKRRLQNKQIKKQRSHDCFFHNSHGIKVRVCRNFFLNTLALGRDTFGRWLNTGFAAEEESNDKTVANALTNKNKEKSGSVVE